jgi:enediyne biosynthesis protein E4
VVVISRRRRCRRGVATFDFDGDGLIDIYFPNGAALPGVTYDPPPRHALYRNLGDWQFQEVSHLAGIDCTAFGLGIAIADYDNDGFPDIYLNNFGPNILYRNNGDGTFTEVTDEAGVYGTTLSGDLSKKVGAGAAFLDLTGNGFFGSVLGQLHRDRLGYLRHADEGPSAVLSDSDGLRPGSQHPVREPGRWHLQDISMVSGIAGFPGRCMGVIACDFDRDGYPDIFVCNDVFANFLLSNDGQGRFTEVGLVAGVAMSPSAEMVANMAVDAGDYDNDGWLDFFTTNYEQQYPLLLRNLGDGNFSNETLAAHAGRSVFHLVNWGCGFVDFDNDTHLDIFIGNGHTDSNVDFLESGGQYRCHNVLLWNTGEARFVDISEATGLRDLPLRAARGIAFEDFDNDGDVDIVILNSREPPTLLSNGGTKRAAATTGCRSSWSECNRIAMAWGLASR